MRALQELWLNNGDNTHTKGENDCGKKSFSEILSMVVSACNKEFYRGASDITDTALECATQIYIAQMNIEQERVRGNE